MNKGGHYGLVSTQGIVTDCLDHYRSLKRELVRAQEEIKRIQSVPLVIGQFMEAIDQKYVSASVSRGLILTEGSQYRYRSELDRLQLRRPHPFHTRPREAETILLGRPSPALERACRYPSTRSRLLDCYAG